MFKQLAAVSAFALCFAAGAIAIAETSAGAAGAGPAAAAQNLAPVDTMSCDQMSAEMASDGQRMRAQLDPQFGADAQAQYNDAMQKEKQIQQQTMSPGNVIACMIPFMCAAAQQQQQQQQNATADAQRNQAMAQTQMNRLNASMNGIDQARVQAISNRFQAMHCQTPH